MSLKPTIVVAVAVCAAVCAVSPVPRAGAAGRISVTSDSFKDGGFIPSAHAFDKENLSPAIAWTGLPEQTVSIALICNDPDAPSGNWIHWVIFNIPATASGLPEGLPADGTFADGAVQGSNDFKKIGYDGPYPPYGTHRYVFTVYALGTTLDLEPGVTAAQVRSAMRGHILAEGSLTGRYKR